MVRGTPQARESHGRDGHRQPWRQGQHTGLETRESHSRDGHRQAWRQGRHTGLETLPLQSSAQHPPAVYEGSEGHSDVRAPPPSWTVKETDCWGRHSDRQVSEVRSSGVCAVLKGLAKRKASLRLEGQGEPEGSPLPRSSLPAPQKKYYVGSGSRGRTWDRL